MEEVAQCVREIVPYLNDTVFTDEDLHMLMSMTSYFARSNGLRTLPCDDLVFHVSRYTGSEFCAHIVSNLSNYRECAMAHSHLAIDVLMDHAVKEARAKGITVVPDTCLFALYRLTKCPMASSLSRIMSRVPELVDAHERMLQDRCLFSEEITQLIVAIIVQTYIGAMTEGLVNIDDDVPNAFKLASFVKTNNHVNIVATIFDQDIAFLNVDILRDLCDIACEWSDDEWQSDLVTMHRLFQGMPFESILVILVRIFRHWPACWLGLEYERVANLKHMVVSRMGLASPKYAWIHHIILCHINILQT